VARRIEAVLVALLAIGCGGEAVKLGDAEPLRLEELCRGENADNPTLTADLLEIYFTSTRVSDLGEGDLHGDVWSARRASQSDPFKDLQALTAVNSNVFDTSPAISSDGLTLWLGSERGGGSGGDVNIYRSTRPDRDSGRWSSPVPEEALNSDKKDIPRPLGQHDQVMPLASQRDSPGVYAIYFATRGEDGKLGFPQAMPELAVPGRSTVDGFLTDDGLVFLFNAELADGQGDLYLSRRSSIDVPFEAPVPLVELNTRGDERDPWLNADQNLLFFSSDRDGPCIYQVPIELAR
jgi:hypothetical protein